MRVHDVSYGSPHAKPHHYHRFPIGDKRATSRVFVSACGGRRSYPFTKGEGRALGPASMARQLERAAFLSTA